MAKFEDVSIDVSKLTGGINDFFTPDKIEDDQWAYARNVYGFENSIKSRSGYQRLTIGSLSGSNRPVAGFGQIQAGTNNYNWGAWNHQLFKLDGTTPGNVSATRIKNNYNTSAGSKMLGFDYFPFSGTKNVVIANGIQTPIRWDGTSAGVVNLSGSAPATSDSFVNFNRYGLLYDFDTLTIYQSNFNDANAGYGANTPIVIPTMARGDIGSGWVQFGDDLIVTTRRSLHKFSTTGISVAPFTRREITHTIGNLSHRAILTIDNGILFVDYTGIYFYDGINVVRASQPIQGTWDQLNQEYLIYAQGCNYKPKNWAVFAVPFGSGQTTNNLVLAYDYLNSVPSKGKFVWWMFDNMTAQSMNIMRNGALVDQWWTGDTSARLFLQDTGTHDNGSAFTQQAFSKAFDWKKPNRDKRLHEARFNIDASGNWNLNVSVDVDLQDSPVQVGTLSLYAGGSLWGSMIWAQALWGVVTSLWPRLKFASTLRGRNIQFRFEVSTINQFFRLYKYIPSVSYKTIRGRDLYTE